LTAQQTCLILGGKGFVGRAIAEEARRRDFGVVVVDKDEYEAAKGTPCDLLINANGNSKKFLARENPRLEFDLSVRSVLYSLNDFPAKRYVHLSTMDVYPDVSDPHLNHEDVTIDTNRQSPYGFHKYLAEQLVRHYAGNWLIYRMAGFVGQGLWKNPIFDLLNNIPLRVHPDSEYQYLNTRDLANSVFEISKQGLSHEIFNITGQGVISLREVSSLIEGHHLDPSCETLPKEHYEMNVEKICRHVQIPKTRDTVSAFVRDWDERNKGNVI
jgi:nucleoside-diphosphate-sugar epimerase